MRGLLAGLLVFICGVAHAACPPDSTIRDWVLGGGLCQAITTFGSETSGRAAAADRRRARRYLGRWCRHLSRRICPNPRRGPELLSCALTRPGYTDDRGRISEGHTYGRQDNYTPDDNRRRRRRHRGTENALSPAAASSMSVIRAAPRSAAC